MDIVNLRYVMVNRNTLPNTYPELTVYPSSSCRSWRHSKLSAPVHSLKGNSIGPRVHCTSGTQSVSYLLNIIYSTSRQKPNSPVQYLMLEELLVECIAGLPHGRHRRDHLTGQGMSGIDGGHSMGKLPFIVLPEHIIAFLDRRDSRPEGSS